MAGSAVAACAADGLDVRHTPGILTLSNANTTVGYCRYRDDGTIEYIFVHPAHRRQGHARRMLEGLRAQLCRPLRLEPPVSLLGTWLLRYCGKVD